MIRDMVRDFAESVLEPTCLERDRNQKAPLAEWNLFCEQTGLQGITIPEEYGGNPVDDVSEAIIVEELDSSDPAMRYEACNACAELSEEEAIPYLLTLFEDEDIDTQSAAIMAAGHIGGDMAKNALMEYIQSSDPVISETAQESLEILRISEGSMDFGTGY